MFSRARPPLLRRTKPATYWVPIYEANLPAVTAFNSLATGAAATALFTIKDPVDSINLKGTIRQLLVDFVIEPYAAGDANTDFHSPPLFYFALWPSTQPVPPTSISPATLKQLEDYYWYHGVADVMPVGQTVNAISGTAGLLKSGTRFRIKEQITTMRKVPARGYQLGLTLINTDPIGWQANPNTYGLIEIFMTLDG